MITASRSSPHGDQVRRTGPFGVSRWAATMPGSPSTQEMWMPSSGSSSASLQPLRQRVAVAGQLEPGEPQTAWTVRPPGAPPGRSSTHEERQQRVDDHGVDADLPPVQLGAVRADPVPWRGWTIEPSLDRRDVVDGDHPAEPSAAGARAPLAPPGRTAPCPRLGAPARRPPRGRCRRRAVRSRSSCRTAGGRRPARSSRRAGRSSRATVARSPSGSAGVRDVVQAHPAIVAIAVNAVAGGGHRRGAGTGV